MCLNESMNIMTIVAAVLDLHAMPHNSVDESMQNASAKAGTIWKLLHAAGLCRKETATDLFATERGLPLAQSWSSGI